jgi:mono/diheme cytochrome c family protein
MPKAKWPLVVLAVVAIALVAAVGVCIAQRSTALLTARHPLPSSAVRAISTPEAIATGAHLTTATACTSCHGADLTGHMIGVGGSLLYAPNLTLVSKRLSDAELDRAIRRGLTPDGKSELAMPSQAYAGFSNDEVGAIIAYLRSLPTKGALAVQPPPGLLLRANLALGVFKPATDKLAAAKPPLDAGPAYAVGRHLAQVACGQCHGTDLSGGKGLPGPDLTVRGYYSPDQFKTLLRTGQSPDERDMGLMASTARTSFSHFSDEEIATLYAYLDARDRALATAPHP